MRLLLNAIIILVALAIGSLSGYWYSKKQDEAAKYTFDMAEANFYFSFIDIQMAEGTDSTKEEAIRSHLVLIEKRKNNTSPIFTESIAATDSALGYARLSALAKKRGAEQEAKKLLTQAVSFCPKMNFAQCDEQKLVSMVQQLDRHSIVGQRLQ